MSDVNVSIGANTTPFINALDRVKNSVTRLSNMFSELGSVLASAGVGTAVMNIIAKADEIGDLAERFRITAKELQQFGAAGKFAGTSMEAVARGLAKIQAAGETSAYMYTLADAVLNAKTQSEEFEIASSILGDKLATELLPMLRLGSEEMQRLGDSTAKLGNKTVSVLSKAQDEITRLKDTITVALGTVIAVVIEPAMNLLKSEATKLGGLIYFLTELIVEAASIAQAALNLDWETAKKGAANYANFVAETLGTSIDTVKKEIDKIWEDSPKDGPKTPIEKPAGELEDETGDKKTDSDLDKMTDKYLDAFDKIKKQHADNLKEREKAEAEFWKDLGDKAKAYADKVDAIDEKIKEQENRRKEELNNIEEVASQSVFKGGVSSLRALGSGAGTDVGLGPQNTQEEQSARMRENSQVLKEINETVKELIDSLDTL